MKLITSASTYSFKLEMFRVHFAAGIESFPGKRKTKNGKLQMTIRWPFKWNKSKEFIRGIGEVDLTPTKYLRKKHILSLESGVSVVSNALIIWQPAKVVFLGQRLHLRQKVARQNCGLDSVTPILFSFKEHGK